mgnify:CR=1 FL=1
MGTRLGAAGVVFYEKRAERSGTAGTDRFCSGGDGGGFGMESSDSGDGSVRRMGRLAFIPAVVGFWIGNLFLLALDHIIPHLHRNSEKAEGPKSRLARTTMLVLAVTLHNIPEGMAVGVVYAGYLTGNTKITAMGALALSIGIAIQNFPEGAIIPCRFGHRG